jgi:hypothetical protein
VGPERDAEDGRQDEGLAVEPVEAATGVHAEAVDLRDGGRDRREGRDLVREERGLERREEPLPVRRLEEVEPPHAARHRRP